MSQKRFTVVAIALLSVSATALYCRAQIRADREQAAALRQRSDTLERQKQEAIALAGPPEERTLEKQAGIDADMLHNSMKIDKALEDAIAVQLQAQQQAGLSGLPPGAARNAVERLLRKRNTQIRVVIPKMRPERLITLINGKALIDETEYTLPKSDHSSISAVNGDITGSVGTHTLHIPRNGHLIWDGGDYGLAPASGQVVIGDDGSVIINGQAVQRTGASG